MLENSVVLGLSPRGQLTLPAALRAKLALRPGDTVTAEFRDGGLFIQAAIVLPVEIYTAAREDEFAAAAKMSTEDLALAASAWGVK